MRREGEESLETVEDMARMGFQYFPMVLKGSNGG